MKTSKSPLNMLGIKQDSSQLKKLERKRDSVNQRIPKHLGGKHPSQKINGEFNTVDDDMDFKSRTNEQIAVLKPKKSPLNNYQNPKREYFSNREDFANLFKTVGDAASAAITKKRAEKKQDEARSAYAKAKKEYNDSHSMKAKVNKNYTYESFDETEAGIKFKTQI